MPEFIEFILLAKDDIKNAKNIDELELIRIKLFGRKGFFALKFSELSFMSLKDRSSTGMMINKAKKELQDLLKIRINEFNKIKLKDKLLKEKIDITLPGRTAVIGSLHPITITINDIKKFFVHLGFFVVYGPEIEDEYHNFDALNIPKHHPSRDLHDTFWLDKTNLLRTQTSGMQIRMMKIQKPPIRIISPGRVYRNDYDQNHTPMFHQIEGLLIDKNITFSNLKYTISNFLFFFLGEKTKIRFRPSYFPFTEPSGEFDIMYKNKKWIEVIGCGMVHPNVLHNVDINPNLYSGFAFGIGIERLAMLKYSINDLRFFFDNDMRFLKQFR